MCKKGIELLYIVFFMLLPVSLWAKDVEAQDSMIFEKYVEQFRNQRDLPIGNLLVNTALFFKGSPYVSSTLDDKNGTESLVINLRQFDCNTFVENCIALALTLKSEDITFTEFKSELQKIRYRSGLIDGYTSRLHYVSDWQYDNAQEGTLSDITPLLGGGAVNKKINFMSTHSHLYKNLKSNSTSIRKIGEIENNIGDRNNYYVIDKKELNNIENKIKDGDIIAFGTSIDGLDYSHIAIAYHSKSKLSFIHASTRTIAVIEEPQSLYNYCSNSKKCTGISVFRINNLQ